MKAYLSDDASLVVVFYDDREDPEWYQVEEFILMYGRDALPVHREEKLPDDTHVDYWQAAVGLVNAWADYQAKRKLYANAADERTRSKVWHVVVERYNGDLMRLRRHERRLYAFLEEELDVFRYHCRLHGVESVDLEWLSKFLFKDTDYSNLREKCRRRAKAAKPPVSLRELI